MAEIPLEWRAYALVQSKLAATTSIVFGDALEEALNVIHEDDFNPSCMSDANLRRRASNAARQERHRSSLRRNARAAARDSGARVDADDIVEAGESVSLVDVLEVRQELAMIEESLPIEDWELISGVAQGVSYEEIAEQRSCTAVALRSRVCRLRQLIIRRRRGPHL